MRRRDAAIGSAVFLVVAPGVVAGVVPWLLTDWQASRPAVPIRLFGGALVVAGAVAVLHAIARFVSDGAGTPAPVAPTQRLVVGGRSATSVAFVRGYEEPSARHGDEYRAYRRAVPGWWPRLRPWTPDDAQPGPR